MNIPLRLIFTGLTCVLGLSLSCFAQGGAASEGPQFGSDPALKELFKPYAGFTAEVQIDMVQKGTALSMLIGLEMRGGDSRTEMDLANLKSADMPAGSIQQMVELGFSPMVSLTTSNETKLYVLYPALKAYASQLMPKQAVLGKGEAKITRTVLARVVLDGHPCDQAQVSVVHPPAKTREFMVWSATDLQDFPIKIEYTEKKDPISMVFKKVRLQVPPEDRFKLPADYTAYKTVQELMQGEMTKAMSKMP